MKALERPCACRARSPRRDGRLDEADLGPLAAELSRILLRGRKQLGEITITSNARRRKSSAAAIKPTVRSAVTDGMKK